MYQRESRSSKNEQLASILRRLRLEAGYTQQNVADSLNINRSTYTYYETGKTTPDIHTLKVLAKVFNVGVDVFLEDDATKILSDPGKRRPKKIVWDKPTTIGQLSSKEKSLIALVRKGAPGTLDRIIEELSNK